MAVVALGALSFSAVGLGAAGMVAAAPLPTEPSVPSVPATPAGVAATATIALEALADWNLTGQPRRYVDFLTARDSAASEAAAILDLDAAELAQAWVDARPSNQVALLAALTQLGVPYRRYSSIEGVGFDCSGLTSYAWGRAGVRLAPQSRTQINAAAAISSDGAAAGDLVYYPGHVMMYLGVGDAIVHSPNSGNHVEIRMVSTSRSLRFGDPLG